MNHLDPDTMTDLGAALAWDDAALQHMGQCAECRARFRDLAALNASLAPVPAREGFETAVLASLEGAPAAATTASIGWSALNALLGSRLSEHGRRHASAQRKVTARAI